MKYFQGWSLQHCLVCFILMKSTLEKDVHKT